MAGVFAVQGRRLALKCGSSFVAGGRNGDRPGNRSTSAKAYRENREKGFYLRFVGLVVDPFPPRVREDCHRVVASLRTGRGVEHDVVLRVALGIVQRPGGTFGPEHRVDGVGGIGALSGGFLGGIKGDLVDDGESLAVDGLAFRLPRVQGDASPRGGPLCRFPVRNVPCGCPVYIHEHEGSRCPW